MLLLDGLVSASNTFLYSQRGTPATDEYQQALRDYSPGSPIGTGMSFGWTAGKLFERAAATISEPPSSQAILAGLWSIHGDTLGGMTAPLTFIKNARSTCSRSPAVRTIPRGS